MTPHPASAGGGDEGTRTPGLLNAIEALSQLSYIPTTRTLPTRGRVNGRQPSVATTPAWSFTTAAPRRVRPLWRSLWAPVPGSHLTTWLSVRDSLLLLFTAFICSGGYLSFAVCGAEGTRTPDLISAIDALSQLSYSPVCL